MNLVRELFQEAIGIKMKSVLSSRNRRVSVRIQV